MLFPLFPGLSLGLFGSTSRPHPGWGQLRRSLNPQETQYPTDSLIDDVADLRGAMVEGRYRREDDRADLSNSDHQFQVSEMQRCLAWYENEPPPIFECDISCTKEKIGAVRGSDPRERLHRAWDDDHPGCLEGSGGNRGRDVVERVDVRRQRSDFLDREIGLQRQCAARGPAHHEMRFNSREFVQDLQQTDGVDCPART